MRTKAEIQADRDAAQAASTKAGHREQAIEQQLEQARRDLRAARAAEPWTSEPPALHALYEQRTAAAATRMTEAARAAGFQEELDQHLTAQDLADAKAAGLAAQAAWLALEEQLDEARIAERAGRPHADTGDLNARAQQAYLDQRVCHGEFDRIKAALKRQFQPAA